MSLSYIIDYATAALVIIFVLAILVCLFLIFKSAIDERKFHKEIINNIGQSNYNLTKEDLEFLIELQHEMLTQDHVGQAAPRFWSVATDEYQELGTEDCFDGINIYSSDDAEVVCGGDMNSIIEYVKENHYDELEEESIVFTYEDDYWSAKFNEEDEETFYCTEELLDFLKEHGIMPDDYDIMYYRNVHYIYPDTMFLTNRSCKEHIKANHYHYSSDAHSYAMTAWRSPEVSRLFDILDKIDWKAMKEEAYGVSSDAKDTYGEATEESIGNSE